MFFSGLKILKFVIIELNTYRHNWTQWSWKWWKRPHSLSGSSVRFILVNSPTWMIFWLEGTTTRRTSEVQTSPASHESVILLVQVVHKIQGLQRRWRDTLQNRGDVIILLHSTSCCLDIHETDRPKHRWCVWVRACWCKKCTQSLPKSLSTFPCLWVTH